MKRETARTLLHSREQSVRTEHSARDKGSKSLSYYMPYAAVFEVDMLFTVVRGKERESVEEDQSLR